MLLLVLVQSVSVCVCVSFGPEPRTAAALGGFKVWGEGLVSRPRVSG